MISSKLIAFFLRYEDLTMLLVVSSDSPTSTSPVAKITDLRHHNQLNELTFLKDKGKGYKDLVFDAFCL